MAQTITLKPKISTAKNKNPFYGKKELLALTHGPVTQSLLDNAAKSCKSKQDWELFFIIIFSIGDIIDRKHEILLQTYGSRSLDNGGNSSRYEFLYCLQWLVNNHEDQFYAFLPLIHEYTNFENLFYYQIRTDRKTGRLLKTISIVPTHPEKLEVFLQKVSEYLVSFVNNPETSSFKLSLLAKFLNYPRFSKRTRINKKGEKVKKALSSAAFAKEVFEAKLAHTLSVKMGWEIIVHKNNTEYVGLKKFMQTYNQMNEDVLFSTKKILGMEKASFISWLDAQPAGARYRIGRRLSFKPEVYANQAAWFKEWLALKETASQEARKLEAKQTPLTEKEKDKLQYLQKAAKVTTGATGFVDIVFDFFTKSSSDLSIVADNLLRKVDFQIPVLPIVDVSASMQQAIEYNKTNTTIAVNDFAALLATIVLLKNPSEDAKNLLFTFNDHCDIITDNSTITLSGFNRYMALSSDRIELLVDKRKSFLDNYQLIRKICTTRGSTSLRSVSERLNKWAKEVPAEKDLRTELVNQFPIVLVISDGDLNSDGSAKESMLAFQHSMRMNFGWEGIVIVWDINQSKNKENKFSDLENVIYLSTFNPSNLTQIFSKIHDLEIVDVYTPLKSLYQSNRYELVKSLVI